MYEEVDKVSLCKILFPNRSHNLSQKIGYALKHAHDTAVSKIIVTLLNEFECHARTWIDEESARMTKTRS